jgi:hypothetical protein
VGTPLGFSIVAQWAPSHDEKERDRAKEEERYQRADAWTCRRVSAGGVRSLAETGAGPGAFWCARGERGAHLTLPCSPCCPLLAGTNRGYRRQRAVSYYARAQLYANSNYSFLDRSMIPRELRSGYQGSANIEVFSGHLQRKRR